MSPMISIDMVLSPDGPLHFHAASAAASAVDQTDRDDCHAQRLSIARFIASSLRFYTIDVTFKLTAAVIILLASLGAATQPDDLQTWKGRISDSICGVKHEPAEGQPMTDKECTLATVRGGSKFVFVSRRPCTRSPTRTNRIW